VRDTGVGVAVWVLDVSDLGIHPLAPGRLAQRASYVFDTLVDSGADRAIGKPIRRPS